MLKDEAIDEAMKAKSDRTFPRRSFCRDACVDSPGCVEMKFDCPYDNSLSSIYAPFVGTHQGLFIILEKKLS